MRRSATSGRVEQGAEPVREHVSVPSCRLVSVGATAVSLPAEMLVRREISKYGAAYLRIGFKSRVESCAGLESRLATARNGRQCLSKLTESD